VAVKSTVAPSPDATSMMRAVSVPVPETSVVWIENVYAVPDANVPGTAISAPVKAVAGHTTLSTCLPATAPDDSVGVADVAAPAWFAPPVPTAQPVPSIDGSVTRFWSAWSRALSSTPTSQCLFETASPMETAPSDKAAFPANWGAIRPASTAPSSAS
jgi:hypothetical protein